MGFFQLTVMLLGINHGLHDSTKIVRGYNNGQRYVLAVMPTMLGAYDGRAVLLIPEAAEAFNEMTIAAAKDGHFIKPNWGYRTNREQREMKRKTGKIAADPGHSDHQRGLAVDINGCIDRSRKNKKTQLFYWLKRNAATYGFYDTVSHEAWHWSYKPLTNLISQN